MKPSQSIDSMIPHHPNQKEPLTCTNNCPQTLTVNTHMVNQSAKSPISYGVQPILFTPPRIIPPTREDSASGSRSAGPATPMNQQTHNPTSPTLIPGFFIYPENLVQEGLNLCNNSILGKLISEKTIHVSTIQNGLDSIWGAPARLRIQEIEGKILQFFVDKKIDHDRILQGNPWTFRNSWLVVKPWDRKVDPLSLDFESVPVWVQLWGLPAHCKTKLMGESLGALMGKVVASELYEYPGKNVIVKIRVELNVNNPLSTGIHVGNPIDGNTWVDFRYENLPLFCFQCGLIGHGEKLCQNPPLNRGDAAPLGPWMRSSQYGRRIMDPKDRKFYSNPSQSKNFGQYSPPVPEEMLRQLADLKLQNTNTNQEENLLKRPYAKSSIETPAGQITENIRKEENVTMVEFTAGMAANTTMVRTGYYTEAKKQKLEVLSMEEAARAGQENLAGRSP